MTKTKKTALFLFIIAAVALIAVYIANLYQPCETCGVEPSTNQTGFWALTLAALADSINPCALAVLMVMLEGLVLIRKSIVKIGLSFVLGIFTAYFLIGVGLLSSLTIVNNAEIFHIIVAILAILVGISNIKDYFWYGLFFKTEIPINWRPKLGETLQKATQPLIAFGVGVVISFFELPCTGGPYLFALGLLESDVLTSNTIFSLLYYNIIFVLPLLIIIFAVHYSYVKIELTENWRKKNVKLFHLITGILLLGLGSWLLVIST